MITISCGLYKKHPQSQFFDWEKFCENDEEKTWCFAQMLKIMDFNNAKIYISCNPFMREKSLFIKKFIEPHIGEDGYTKDSIPDYAYWTLPDGEVISIMYSIHQYDNEQEAQQ